MIKDVIVFYRNPYSYFDNGKAETMHEKLILFRNAFIFCLSSAFIIVLILTFLEIALKSTFDISIATNLFKNKDGFRARNDHWEAFLKTSVLGPFEEEFIFRLILVTKSPFLRFLILLGWVEYFTSEFLPLRFFSLYYNAILLIILLAIITSKKISDQDFPTIFKKESYNYLCWGLTLAFALVHISNFAPLNWSFIYLYPVYVLPQFVYGVVFSYVAIRYNSIVWPFLLHAAINSTSEIHRLLSDIFH